MAYQPPLAEYLFVLDHVVGFAAVRASSAGAGLDAETAAAILTEAGRLAAEEIAPLNPVGDANPARMEAGRLHSSPGFAEGHRAIAAGGWIGMAARPESGGLGLPMALATPVNEMLSAACLALQLNIVLTQGQIEALEHHASPELAALVLPKLTSGLWSGTMNLTEPQAGSDVGALTSRAERNADGTYAVTGQKIYITWGDCEFVENVCHLVLARLPDGPAGTKGISLFLVPKFLIDADGRPGTRNRLSVVSLEHKMGLHGSPTAVMSYDGATGWLVGEPHRGMACMFTMMNNARLGVAAQGVGVAEAALQAALAHAANRHQGGRAIIAHPDVQRMLATMQAEVFTARAIVLACAVATDLAKGGDDPLWQARAALLTPIAKVFGTETGCKVADLCIQVHGGAGFIEATGVAQYLRDVRITAIYEGTNGIQGIDLSLRKMADGGVAAMSQIDEIAFAARAAKQFPALAAPIQDAAEALRVATLALLALDTDDRLAAASAYLAAFGTVLGAHFHLLAAEADPARAPLAAFAIMRLLPRHAALLAEVEPGAASLAAVFAGRGAL